MVVEAQRVRIHKSVLVRNRRPGLPELPDDGFIFDQTFIGLNAFLRLTPADLAPYKTISAEAGDGTDQRLFRLVHALKLPPDKIPTFYLKGGGSANTLFRGLTYLTPVPIPEEQQEYFSPDKYTAYRYKPPVLIHDTGKMDPCAYLISLGHLGVRTTMIKDDLTKNDPGKDIQAIYVQAAIQSLKQLGNRTRPTNIQYRVNGQTYDLAQNHVAAFETIAVPVLATFEVKKKIAENQVRLILIRANTSSALYTKYLLSLVVGSRLGIDAAIKMSLVETIDADEISVSPDLSKKPNCCTDGQQETLTDQQILIKRSPESFLIITPR